MFHTKEGMLHASSQAESSTKLGKDPDYDPEPDKDIHMGNNEDSDDSDDSDDLYIVSRKWQVEYFGINSEYNSVIWLPMPDVYGTYIKPYVDQPLNSVTDIFANSKTIISINEHI